MGEDGESEKIRKCPGGEVWPRGQVRRGWKGVPWHDQQERRSSATFLRSIEVADLRVGSVPALHGHLHGTKGQLRLMWISPE